MLEICIKAAEVGNFTVHNLFIAKAIDCGRISAYICKLNIKTNETITLW